jgi:flagellar basal body P-ring protein FlgI
MFVKGKSGNPNGRPRKEHSLTDLLRDAGEIVDAEINGEKVSRNQALAHLVWKVALKKRDFNFIKHIYDRLDGPVKQQIEQTIVQEQVNLDDLTEEQKAALLAVVTKE